MKKRLFLAAGLAATLMGVAACGNGSSSAEGSGSEGKALTVWLMDGSVPADLIDALTKDFEAAHSGSKLKVEIQQWNGIQDKLTTALASSTPPDVVELGNTQTAKFSQSGALADLSDKVSDLGGDDWLPGLADSGKWDGQQYGIPFYAANRFVIYRTDLFEAAGVRPPKTRDDWLDITRALNQANSADPDFQGIYLPGQSWYDFAGFLWDEGGDFAIRDGDQWKGALDTPQAAAAMDYYKELQSLSKAKKDTDEATPQQFEVFAKGNVAQMIGLPWELASAVDANAQLDGKLGTFAIPGKTAEQSGAVFLGGSNIGIAAGSKKQDLAYDFVKLLTGTDYETKLAKANNFVPNQVSLAGVLTDKVATVMAGAAANGKVTPVDPRWAAVEAGANPIKDYLTAVLTGTDPMQAGKRASDEITKRMSTSL